MGDLCRHSGGDCLDSDTQKRTFAARERGERGRDEGLIMQDWMFQVLGMIAGAAGVYAAIKSDLTKAIITAENAGKSADSCHTRLDKHIEINHSR